jgi:Holliday junction resolvase RusA-like endonuclease
MLTYTLTGNIPSKKNSRITNRKTGRSFPSKDYTAWHEMASDQIAAQNPAAPLSVVKSITAHIYFPTKRRADCSNKWESLGDLLVDCGVLADDSWQVVPELHLYGEYRKNEGGAVIEINT